MEDDHKDANKSDSPKPLRQYKDDSQTTQESMLLFRIKVTAYWLVPLTIFCLILFGGIFVALKYNGFVGLTSEGMDRPPPYIMASGEVVVPELIDRYLIAVGGREALESIRSVRYKGRLIEDTGEIKFQILISVPDKGMIITEPGEDYSQRLVLNGDTAWQIVELGGGARKIVPLNEANTTSLAWSLRVHNTFRRLALDEDIDGYSVKTIEFKGKPCFELTKTMPDGSPFLAVLDQETLYLLKSVETVPGAEGMERLEAVYDDHRRVSGIVLPHATTTYKHGEIYNESVLDSIEFDPGLVSALFEVPEELSK